MVIYGTDMSIFVPDADPSKTTNPLLKDTDGDGLWDGWNPSISYLNPKGGEDSRTITGRWTIWNDTVAHWADGSVSTITANGIGEMESDPTNPDSDGDGLKDGADPYKRDCDGDEDGLWDGPNVGDCIGEFTYGTKAWSSDSDGDLIPDNIEVSLKSTNVKINQAELNGYLIWFTASLPTEDQDMETHTLPTNSDSDWDGLSDGQEDKDKDGWVDGDNNFNKIWDAGELWTETDPNNPDTDGDYLEDGDEYDYKDGIKYDWDSNIDGDQYINALDKDSDSDGLEDCYEKSFKTNMVKWDTDGDNLADGDNITIGTINWIGENAYGTSPINSDTDGDKIPDGTEVGILWSFAVTSGVYVWDADNGTTTTNPLAKDTDGDGLPDGWIDGWDRQTGKATGVKNSRKDLGEFEDFNLNGAVKIYAWNTSWLVNATQEFGGETNPCAGLADTDGDYLSDWDEVMVWHTDPLKDADSDGDGLSDGKEIFDIFAGILGGNLDEDDLLNGPTDPDTDGDGVNDGMEVNGWEVTIDGIAYTVYSDPVIRDTDRDTISDGDEYLLGTDPDNKDSDEDGLLDHWELLSEVYDEPTIQDTTYSFNHYVPALGSYTLNFDAKEVSGTTPNIFSFTQLSIILDNKILDTWHYWYLTIPQTNFITMDTTTISLDKGYHQIAFMGSSAWQIRNIRLERQETNPISNDTDADGLIDGIEIEGWYTFKIDIRTDSAGAEWHVIGDPLSDLDRDGDGLNDVQEFSLGTDPVKRDTDGDFIPDNLDKSEYDDPLLVDYIGPTLATPQLSEELVYSWWGIISPFLIVDHVWVTASTYADDLAGIRYVNASVMGEDETYSMTQDAYGEWSCKFGIDFVGQYVTGYKVIVTAIDNNWNMNQSIQNGGALEWISSGISWLMMFTTVPYYNGQLTGSFHGFAGALFSEVDFMLHITEILDMIGQIVDAIGTLYEGGWSGFIEMINATYTDFHELTERINPYPENGWLMENFHDQFNYGFMMGYVGGIVAEMILVAWVTAGVGEALGISQKIAKVGKYLATGATTLIKSAIKLMEGGKYLSKVLGVMRWLKSGILAAYGAVSSAAQSLLLRASFLIETTLSSGSSIGSMGRAIRMAAKASVTFSDDGIRGLSSYVLRNGGSKADDIVRALGSNADDVFRGVGKGLFSESDDLTVLAVKIERYAARTGGDLVDDMDNFINTFRKSFDDPDFADGIRHVSWNQKKQIADDMLRIADGEPLDVYRYTDSQYLDDLINEGRYNTKAWQGVEDGLWREDRGIYTSLDDATAQAEAFRSGEYIKTTSSYSSNQPNYGLYPSARDGNGINLVDYDFLDDAGRLANNFDEITIYVQQGNREIPVLISEIERVGDGYRISRLGLEYDSIDSLIDDLAKVTNP